MKMHAVTLEKLVKQPAWRGNCMYLETVLGQERVLPTQEQELRSSDGGDVGNPTFVFVWQLSILRMGASHQ
jgi:hypothetical protein